MSAPYQLPPVILQARPAVVRQQPQVDVGVAPPPMFPGLAVAPQTYPDIELLKRFLMHVKPWAGR